MKNYNLRLVSVIIPYFNKKKYFKQAFLSAYHQTYKQLEIIIVYDNFLKNDLSFIKKIINNKKKKKISLIINKHNLGAGLSRNIGLKAAKGEYIAFLDADDNWKKNKIEKQIKFMKKNKIQICFSAYDIIDSDNKIIGERFAKKKINFNDLVKSCDIGLSTVILKKKILNDRYKFPNLKTKEDYVLWLSLSKKNNFYGINEILSQWRKLDNSLSSNVIQKMIDGFRVYHHYLKFNFLKSICCLILLSLNFLKKSNFFYYKKI